MEVKIGGIEDWWIQGFTGKTRVKWEDAVMW